MKYPDNVHLRFGSMRRRFETITSDEVRLILVIETEGYQNESIILDENDSITSSRSGSVRKFR